MAAYDEDDGTVPASPVNVEKGKIDTRTQEVKRVSDVGNYRSALVNTRYTDLTSLITHIGGSLLIADYYHNLGDSDDELSPPQFDQAGAYQQYSKIYAMEMKVQTPIDPKQYNEEGDSFTALGVAIIYGTIRPNRGDAFIADIGDGRLGLLVISKTQPLSYLKDTAYQIEYSIHKYVDEYIQTAMDDKVVNTYYFDVEDLRSGGTGLLSEVQVEQYEKLEKSVRTMAVYHMSSFHNIDVESLVYVKDDQLAYDQFIPGVMRDILPMDVLVGLPRNRELNCQDVDSNRVKTIWDVLLNNAIEYLSIIHKGFTMVKVNTFPWHPQYVSVLYSGVQIVSVPTLLANIPKDPVESHTETGDFEGVMPEIPVLPVKPRMHPLHLHGYIFSNYFYANDRSKMSQFECLVMDYLDNLVIDIPKLNSFIKDVDQWTQEVKFHIIPVLLILGTVALKQRSVS